jgi:alanine racemase
VTAHQTLLTIDLDALAANFATFVREAAGAEVAPAVKADGYGMGAVEVARRLMAEGARAFFIARLEEAEVLRAALGPGPTLYVLDGATPGSGARLQAAVLTPVLNTTAQVEEWAARGRGGPALAAALHVDTGMNRLGLSMDEAEALAAAADRLHGLRLELVMSHLACADDPPHPLNARQLAAFRDVRRLFPDARASFANSAGVFLGEDYLFDQVRPGISLYGGGPRGRPDPRIRAVATFEAKLLQIRTAGVGETVGYGATHAVERPTRIGIIAAGYADGLLRSGSNQAFAAFEGQRCPVLGRVSMDLIAVDLGEAAAAPGDLIQLLGPDAPLDEAAARAGTIPYEILTRLGPRAERRYLGAVR